MKNYKVVGIDEAIDEYINGGDPLAVNLKEGTAKKLSALLDGVIFIAEIGESKVDPETKKVAEEMIEAIEERKAPVGKEVQAPKRKPGRPKKSFDPEVHKTAVELAAMSDGKRGRSSGWD